MIYILGDIHIRKEEPYYSAIDQMFRKLYEVCKPGDTIIQLGDFFHSYKPFPKEYSLAFYWIEAFSLRGVKFIILSGNNAHEYHHLQKTYAIDPLISFKNVSIIKDIEVLTIDKVSFLFLPWMPESLIKERGFEKVEDYLKSFVETNSLKNIIYFMYHYEDETVFMGGENRGIDFSFVEEMIPGIARIGGHIHLKSDNYIGAPFQMRFDEKGQVGEFFTINSELTGDSRVTNHFSQFIIHKEISFEEKVPIPEFDGQKFVVNVVDAPSVDSVYDKFKKEYIFINDISLKFSEKRISTLTEEIDSQSSMKELLSEYITINKVDKKTSEYLLSLF